MWRRVLLWGTVCGLGVAFLKYIEYRWLVVNHAVEIWGALVAATFAGLGAWLGRRWLAGGGDPAPPPEAAAAVPAPAAAPFRRDESRVRALALTPRELEVLDRVAEGLSTREIAARLFVSENTVKTHVSRLLDKLGARRRTQAVQRARELGLIA